MKKTIITIAILLITMSFLIAKDISARFYEENRFLLARGDYITDIAIEPGELREIREVFFPDGVIDFEVGLENIYAIDSNGGLFVIKIDEESFGIIDEMDLSPGAIAIDVEDYAVGVLYIDKLILLDYSKSTLPEIRDSVLFDSEAISLQMHIGRIYVNFSDSSIGRYVIRDYRELHNKHRLDLTRGAEYFVANDIYLFIQNPSGGFIVQEIGEAGPQQVDSMGFDDYYSGAFLYSKDRLCLSVMDKGLRFYDTSDSQNSFEIDFASIPDFARCLDFDGERAICLTKSNGLLIYSLAID